MRVLLLAAAAALSLSACGTLPSPSTIAGRPDLADKVKAFCAADFVDSNAAALTEWVMLYNAVAPLIDREPIVGSLTENEAVKTLLAVRSAVCQATAPLPAPAVLEAVTE